MYRLLQPLAQWLFRPWALLAMLSFTTAAQPISTSWMTDPNHPPVSVRFVLTGQIDSDTQQLAGYLDVKLEQPWKTYWRSPGEGGEHRRSTGKVRQIWTLSIGIGHFRNVSLFWESKRWVTAGIPSFR